MKIIRHQSKQTEAEEEESVKMTIEDATIVSDSDSISDSDEECSDSASESSQCSDCSNRKVDEANPVDEHKGTSIDKDVEGPVMDQEMDMGEGDGKAEGESGHGAAMQKRLSEAEYRLVAVATIAEEVEARLLARITSVEENNESEIGRIDEIMEENGGEVEDALYKMDEEIVSIKKKHSELQDQVEKLWGKKQNPGDAIEDKKAHIRFLEAELKVKREELRVHLMKEIALLDSSEGSGEVKVAKTRSAESQGGNGVGKKARKG